MLRREGWNLSLGAITWAQHNVQENSGGSRWQDSWRLTDPFGTSDELLPPATNISTFYDNSPNSPSVYTELQSKYLSNINAARIHNMVAAGIFLILGLIIQAFSENNALKALLLIGAIVSVIATYILPAFSWFKNGGNAQVIQFIMNIGAAALNIGAGVYSWWQQWAIDGAWFGIKEALGGVENTFLQVAAIVLRQLGDSGIGNISAGVAGIFIAFMVQDSNDQNLALGLSAEDFCKSSLSQGKCGTEPQQ